MIRPASTRVEEGRCAWRGDGRRTPQRSPFLVGKRLEKNPRRRAAMPDRSAMVCPMLRDVRNCFKRCNHGLVREPDLGTRK